MIIVIHILSGHQQPYRERQKTLWLPRRDWNSWGWTLRHFQSFRLLISPIHSETFRSPHRAPPPSKKPAVVDPPSLPPVRAKNSPPSQRGKSAPQPSSFGMPLPQITCQPHTEEPRASPATASREDLRRLQVCGVEGESLIVVFFPTAAWQFRHIPQVSADSFRQCLISHMKSLKWPALKNEAFNSRQLPWWVLKNDLVKKKIKSYPT